MVVGAAWVVVFCCFSRAQRVLAGLNLCRCRLCRCRLSRLAFRSGWFVGFPCGSVLGQVLELFEGFAVWDILQHVLSVPLFELHTES